MVAAQAILASCTLASAGEGINWKRIAWKSPQESYSGRRITDAWEKVTDVLKEARNNATFPGIYTLRTNTSQCARIIRGWGSFHSSCTLFRVRGSSG